MLKTSCQKTKKPKSQKHVISYCKRKKQRYFLVELIPTSNLFYNNNNSETTFSPLTSLQQFTSAILMERIKSIFHKLYGKLGYSCLFTGTFKIIYFDNLSGLMILACPQKLQQMFSTALTFISWENHKFLSRTLAVTGTIKKCRKLAVEHHMHWLKEKATLIKDLKVKVNRLTEEDIKEEGEEGEIEENLLESRASNNLLLKEYKHFEQVDTMSDEEENEEGLEINRKVDREILQNLGEEDEEIIGHSSFQTISSKDSILKFLDLFSRKI